MRSVTAVLSVLSTVSIVLQTQRVGAFLEYAKEFGNYGATPESRAFMTEASRKRKFCTNGNGSSNRDFGGADHATMSPQHHQIVMFATSANDPA